MTREPNSTAPRTGPRHAAPGPGASLPTPAVTPPGSRTETAAIPLSAVLPRVSVTATTAAGPRRDVTAHGSAHTGGSVTAHGSAHTGGSVTASDAADRRASDTPSGRPQLRRGLVLGIVLIAQLMVVLDSSIVNIALPDMAVALHFSPTSLSWVINAYTLAFGGLLLLGARAGDILGRRRVFAAGVTLFTLASLAGGFAGTAGELLTARVVQGIGAAFAAPSALAILMTLFPETRERTRALGWFAAVSVGGAAIGLIAGGLLTQWASWRWVMFVNVPIGAALVVGILTALPMLGRGSGRFDLAGALTSTAGVTAVVYALVRAATAGWDDPLVLLGLAGGALLLSAFVMIELRAESPITPLRLFASRNRSASHLVRLLMVAGMFGMFFFLTQFVQEILGYSPIQAGVAFLPLTVFLFAASMITARVLAPRIAGRTLMITGLSSAAVGLLLASTLDAGSSYLSLLLPLVLFGLGAGLTFVPMTAMSLDGVAGPDAGAASGLVNVSQQVGGAIGLAVLVTVFGHTASPNTPGISGAAARAARAAFVTGESRALLVGAALMAGAALLTAVAIRRPAAPVRAVEAAEEPELTGDLAGV